MISSSVPISLDPWQTYDPPSSGIRLVIVSSELNKDNIQRLVGKAVGRPLTSLLQIICSAGLQHRKMGDMI